MMNNNSGCGILLNTSSHLTPLHLLQPFPSGPFFQFNPSQKYSLDYILPLQKQFYNNIYKTLVMLYKKIFFCWLPFSLFFISL